MIERLAVARRIALVGNGGGGKSTIARVLAARLELPLHVVDDVQWLPGWRAASVQEVSAAHAGWLASPEWIIDGWGPWSDIETRCRAAEAVVFIDLPLTLHLWGALCRQVQAMAGRREGWPPAGCSATAVTWRMARTLVRVNRVMLPRLRALLADDAIAARVLHVTTPRERAALLGGA